MKLLPPITSGQPLLDRVHHCDALTLLRALPDGCVDLVVTSPPYNMGKDYETKISIDKWLSQQSLIIREAKRCLSEKGSVCWQVGNYVKDGSIIPLDSLLYSVFSDVGFTLRNRIVWHFGHGLHAKNRFSGRYEVILWFTNKVYKFNLDPVRVPQKHPDKRHYKGAKRGYLSCNPLGKNPSDVWGITNVKNNHPEKTNHPCQFPELLVERCILSMSDTSDIVLDPFVGSGTTAKVARDLGRHYIGCDISSEYVQIARDRLALPYTPDMFDTHQGGERTTDAIPRQLALEHAQPAADAGAPLPNSRPRAIVRACDSGGETLRSVNSEKET